MKQVFFKTLGLTIIWLSFTILAAPQVVPIFELNFEDSGEGDAKAYFGSLLGGIENGRWLDAKTTFRKLKGNETYSLFQIDAGKKGEISLGKVKDESECGEYFVTGETKISAPLAIGSSATWNAMPRLPKAVALTEAGYLKAVADVLKSKGFSKSAPKIEQAFRVDLEGDGVEEVVLVANQYEVDENYNPKIGNYSFVLIQKLIGGKTQTIFVAGNFEKGEYMGGVFKLSAIADLNGDGKLELVVSVHAYNGEENWLHVFEMKGGKPSEVKALYNYCGV
jgi:hypothetical protein